MTSELVPNPNEVIQFLEKCLSSPLHTELENTKFYTELATILNLSTLEVEERVLATSAKIKKVLDERYEGTSAQDKDSDALDMPIAEKSFVVTRVGSSE